MVGLVPAIHDLRHFSNNPLDAREKLGHEETASGPVI
jgi:hypothetical protein